MANICLTSLSIQKNATCASPTFADDAQMEALRKDIEERAAYNIDVTFEHSSDDLIDCSIGTRSNVPVDALRGIAKTHVVNIRAVGREDGCGFIEGNLAPVADDLGADLDQLLA
jgi:hypothetical protein